MPSTHLLWFLSYTFSYGRYFHQYSGHSHRYSVNCCNFDVPVGEGGFPGGPEVKNLPCNAGDMDSTPGEPVCSGAVHHN